MKTIKGGNKMRKGLAFILATLIVLSVFPIMSVYAWDKPSYDRSVTATVENARQAQLVVPLWNNPHMQPYQDYMSPFTFDPAKYAPGKINGRLPAMGFNTWNYFASSINENIIMEIADSFIRLGLDKVGYEYVGIDDGCYERTRQRGPDGELIPDPTYFPSGFKFLADYCHSLGIKIAMYNDVGYNTCNGMCQSSWGHEDQDAMSYALWDIDYIKYDYCNNPWAGAPNLAAPNLRNVKVSGNNGFEQIVNAATNGVIGAGNRSYGPNSVTASSVTINAAGYINGSSVTVNTAVNGTTGDVTVTVNAPNAGVYDLAIEYAVANATTNRWLQVDVNGVRMIDGKQEPTGSATTFVYSPPVQVQLNAGANTIRLYCEKRREIGEEQYCAFFDSLQKAKAATGKDIIFSLCEWGNTQPWLWAWKVGNSWRTTGDITYTWSSMTNIYSQNVVLDDFAGLDRGWNDPDMLEVGNDRSTSSSFLLANFKENESHFNLWCMENSPLLLGNDLRKVNVGDDIWKVITNEDVIALNQDPLGVQAKRVKVDAYTSTAMSGTPTHPNPSVIVYSSGTTHNQNRLDYLVKPLANGDLALMITNFSTTVPNTQTTAGSITVGELVNGTSDYGIGIGAKMVNKAAFEAAQFYKVADIGAKSKETFIISKDTPISVNLLGHGSKTYRISALAAPPTMGIAAPAVLDTVISPTFSYDISVSNIADTNTIEITAKFDGAKLDYVDSVIALPASSNVQFFGAPTFDAATGVYKATVVLLRQGALFDISAATKLVTVNFAVKGGLVHQSALQGSLSSGVYYELQPDGIKTIPVNVLLTPAAANSSITTHARFDINKDGVIDAKDISAIIFNYYLLRAGSANWDAAKEFDANGDGFIDLEDLLIIGTYFS